MTASSVLPGAMPASNAGPSQRTPLTVASLFDTDIPSEALKSADLRSPSMALWYSLGVSV
ncbi:hypothetical protein D3C71_2079040 [compost metagenome]